MPIHLTSIHRRTFLKTSIGAGVSLLSFRLNAEGSTGDGPDRVALLADTHINADTETVVHDSVMSVNLQKVIDDIRRQPQKPAMALIDGDCAHLAGRPEDYKALSNLVTGFSDAGIPLHMTMGNHDDRVAFLKQFETHSHGTQAVAGKHVTLIKMRHANWFLIDTLLEVNKVTGEVGDEQRHWLHTALNANSDKPAVIVGHHNPQFAFTKGVAISGMKDSEAVFVVLDGQSHVQAYIFGHSHEWKLTRRNSGIHLINLPPVGYVFNKKNPIGWVDANVHANGINLELHALDESHSEHKRNVQLHWRG